MGDAGENTALNDARRPTLVSPTEAEQLKTMEPYKFTESGYPLYRIQRKVNGQIHDVKIMGTTPPSSGTYGPWRRNRGFSRAAQPTDPGHGGRVGALRGRLPRLRTMQSAMISGMNWAVLPLLLSQPIGSRPLLRANGNS